ncbi:MAG: hypothetical protein U5N58_03475 [Actinomycetota bacterium]|nr:hypothetical protein [Actinomycetota bacterium]
MGKNSSWLSSSAAGSGCWLSAGFSASAGSCCDSWSCGWGGGVFVQAESINRSKKGVNIR